MSVRRSPSISAFTRTLTRSSPFWSLPRLRELARVHPELGGGDSAVLVRRLELRVVEADEPVRPVEELVPVVLRNAEEVGDDVERKLGGDRGHEVGAPLGGDPIDDLRGSRADARLEAGDHPRREAGARELAELVVLRRIHVQHHQLDRRQVLLRVVLDVGAAAVRRERVRVLRDGEDVVVLGDAPEARARPAPGGSGPAPPSA